MNGLLCSSLDNEFRRCSENQAISRHATPRRQVFGNSRIARDQRQRGSRRQLAEAHSELQDQFTAPHHTGVPFRLRLRLAVRRHFEVRSNQETRAARVQASLLEAQPAGNRSASDGRMQDLHVRRSREQRANSRGLIFLPQIFASTSVSVSVNPEKDYSHGWRGNPTDQCHADPQSRLSLLSVGSPRHPWVPPSVFNTAKDKELANVDRRSRRFIDSLPTGSTEAPGFKSGVYGPCAEFFKCRCSPGYRCASPGRASPDCAPHSDCVPVALIFIFRFRAIDVIYLARNDGLLFRNSASIRPSGLIIWHCLAAH